MYRYESTSKMDKISDVILFKFRKVILAYVRLHCDKKMWFPDNYNAFPINF